MSLFYYNFLHDFMKTEVKSSTNSREQIRYKGYKFIYTESGRKSYARNNI